jgi:hypothetical protein
MRPYPYGTTYKKGTCTDDKTWIAPNWTVLGTWPSAAAKAEAERLDQADPSGARAGCVSDEGVRDLTGNVAEWVRRSFGLLRRRTAELLVRQPRPPERLPLVRGRVSLLPRSLTSRLHPESIAAERTGGRARRLRTER